VIPIEIPPLCERQEDIPLLARHFIKKYSAIRNREIKVIPPEFMDHLMQRSWPGNIRELENVIERTVVLSKGDTLSLPFEGVKQIAQQNRVVQSLPVFDGSRRRRRTPEEDAKQRRIIVEALEYAQGMIGGPLGAAVHLGLKRTTLINRMRALGISMKRSCC
jgi:formate hydrogenlyase transcriptional activator